MLGDRDWRQPLATQAGDTRQRSVPEDQPGSTGAIARGKSALSCCSDVVFLKIWPKSKNSIFGNPKLSLSCGRKMEKDRATSPCTAAADALAGSGTRAQRYHQAPRALRHHHTESALSWEWEPCWFAVIKTTKKSKNLGFFLRWRLSFWYVEEILMIQTEAISADFSGLPINLFIACVSSARLLEAAAKKGNTASITVWKLPCQGSAWDTDDQHYSLKDLLSLQGNAAGVLQEKNVAEFPPLCMDFSQLMHCLNPSHVVLSAAFENRYWHVFT